ncbi:glycosyltransferase [Pullulanibacillus sp. KACC 23026]|uniref:MGDG synthase family glycosyltransferase n=1 Tax=Pullulanibacillus sp. KACC 23026 TaxID=3028315 RepID=UPI0023B0FD57|nr:glycosyltransferase [Pullulanibacillus sp. KACC 23026]WEG12083.1 glycosyltransferase [Pullulanibacillus sp. KACC 23026]
MKKPTVLILYANYGAGHKRAADAIEEKLKLATVHHRDAMIIHKTDFLGQAFPLIDQFMRKLYIQSFHWAKPFYKKLYYQTKDLPIDSSVTSLFTYLGSLKLEAYIRQMKADVVISTFPALTGMLSQIKKRGQTSFKLCCVLTDYTTHNHWLYQHVDHYFVPTNQIKKEFIARGIPAETIQSTGIPVLAQFEEKRDLEQLKANLGVSSDRPIVLISAGAYGVTNFASVCVTFHERYPEFQFVVICGKNASLFKRLSKVQGLKVIGFTDQMAEWLQVADLYLTKAGGLSISEAIAAETPMLLYGSLPGQEMENVQFLTRANVARAAETEEELIRCFEAMIQNDFRLLKRLKAQIKALRKSICHHERWLTTVQTECKTEQFASIPSPYRSRAKNLSNRLFKKGKRSFQI